MSNRPSSAGRLGRRRRMVRADEIPSERMPIDMTRKACCYPQRPIGTDRARIRSCPGGGAPPALPSQAPRNSLCVPEEVTPMMDITRARSKREGNQTEAARKYSSSSHGARGLCHRNIAQHLIACPILSLQAAPWMKRISGDHRAAPKMFVQNVIINYSITPAAQEAILEEFCPQLQTGRASALQMSLLGGGVLRPRPSSHCLQEAMGETTSIKMINQADPDNSDKRSTVCLAPIDWHQFTDTRVISTQGTRA